MAQQNFPGDPHALQSSENRQIAVTVRMTNERRKKRLPIKLRIAKREQYRLFVDNRAQSDNDTANRQLNTFAE